MPILIALFSRLGLSQGVARVLGFVVPLALAALLLGLLWARGTHYRDQRDTARAQVVAVNARLAVSNASIASLQAVIDQRNAEIAQHAKDYAAEKQRADSEAVKLADLARGSDAKIARLNELAKVKGDCAVKPETRKLAEGL